MPSFLPNSKYTLSSDKVEGLTKPSVRLQLSLDAGAGERENLLYEMNDQELDDLLRSLQAIADARGSK